MDRPAPRSDGPVERPPAWLEERAARLLGGPLTGWVRATSGFTRAERWRAAGPDGRGVFVKGVDDPSVKQALRTEARVYAALHGPFLPRRLAGDDRDDRPVLVLEDLGAARWPPPWQPGDVEAVLEALEQAHRSRALPDLPEAARALREDLAGWGRVAVAPEPFLRLGLVTRGWLERALPALGAAERVARLDGDALLHLDVRSDNLCFVDGRAVLVDWSWALRGNPQLDLAFWAPSLAYEGGPAPEDLLGHEPALAAAVSGYFASHAGLPADPPPPRVREVQRRQLAEALPWAVRALRLPPLDGPAAARPRS